jgi:hypothetical protein
MLRLYAQHTPSIRILIGILIGILACSSIAYLGTELADMGLEFVRVLLHSRLV